MVLDVDLNDPPPVENVFLMSNPISAGTNWLQVPDLGLSLAQATIDVEHADDEVVICSPRSFAEAREKSRRNRELIEVLEESESLRARSARLSSSGKRRRRAPSKQMTGSNNLCINLERHETTANEHVAVPQQLPQLVPQPRATAFTCPVCRGSFVEETSTKCGHIFCQKCISTAIMAQSKCPTCRRKLKAKDTFRVYLPISE